MCGLVGIVGDLAYRDEETMRRLLLFDYLRGPDSTGLASIRIDNDVRIAKINADPITLFDTMKFRSTNSGNMSKVFIGHNRAATRGSVSSANAHPFHHGSIVGAHNGTLEYEAFNRLEEALGERFQVDSEAIIAGLDRLGVEETIRLLSGAWSLAWYDLSEGTFNLLRNDQRPMYYGFTHDFKRMFYASEWEIIAASVGGMADHKSMRPTPLYSMYIEEGTGHKFWPTDVDVHYSWNVADFRLNHDGTRPKAKAKKCEGMPPPPAKVTTMGTKGGTGGTSTPFEFPNQKGKGSTNGTATKKPGCGFHTPTSTTTSHGTTNNPRLAFLDGDDHEPFAGYIKRETFERYAKDGCGFCSADVDFFDEGITIYEREEAVLCASCSDNKSGHSRVYSKNDLYLT